MQWPLLLHSQQQYSGSMGPRLHGRQEAHHGISHVVVNCRRKPGEMQQQLHRLVITLRSFPAVPTRPNQEYSYCVVTAQCRISFQSRTQPGDSRRLSTGCCFLTIGRLVKLHLQLGSALLLPRWSVEPGIVTNFIIITRTSHSC